MELESTDEEELTREVLDPAEVPPPAEEPDRSDVAMLMAVLVELCTTTEELDCGGMDVACDDAADDDDPAVEDVVAMEDAGMLVAPDAVEEDPRPEDGPDVPCAVEVAPTPTEEDAVALAPQGKQRRRTGSQCS